MSKMRVEAPRAILDGPDDHVGETETETGRLVAHSGAVRASIRKTPEPFAVINRFHGLLDDERT